MVVILFSFSCWAITACFEHEVDGSGGGDPHPAEAGFMQDVGEHGRTGLGSDGASAWLVERTRRADQGGRAVEDPANDVEVVLDGVAGHRLDDHQGAVLGQGTERRTRRGDRVAHVVQAVEHGDHVGGAGREAVASATSKRTRSETPAASARRRATVIDASW